MTPRMLCCFVLSLFAAAAPPALQAARPARHPKQLVLIDTDIGDDIDDAFAVALALQSPELHIVGITTTFGDTALRARLLCRFLAETGHGETPVAAGPRTPGGGTFTQKSYAAGGGVLSGAKQPAADPAAQDAFLLFHKRVRAYPQQVTLIALGPLNTVESWMDRDPATFRLLRNVVMMGGSVHEGYRAAKDPGRPTPPEPEWNIHNDPEGFRKLLGSGVPLTLLPLDSTQIPLDGSRRERILARGSPLTDNLRELLREWGQGTPTLFDPLTVATVVDPTLCPAAPMRLRVDATGNTVPEEGKANVAVCLRSERERFLDLLTGRLTVSGYSERR